jgi:ABC-type transporter Mla subunit MlaD
MWWFTRIERKLDALLGEVNGMSQQLEDLKTATAKAVAAASQAVTAINSLSAQITSKDDPAELKPLVDALGASADALNAAVATAVPPIV